MVDIPDSSEPDNERPITAGPGHVKKMISLFSNGFVINGNEPSLASANSHSQVIGSGQFTAEITEEATSPSKSSNDELDNCIKTNYVASRILNFEGINDVDPAQLKTRGRPSAYRKVNGLDPRRQNGNRTDTNGSAGDGSHVIVKGGKLSKGDHFRLQNGQEDGVGLSQANGFEHRCEETSDHRYDDVSDSRCDQPSVSNGAISHNDNTNSDLITTTTTPLPSSDNGSVSGAAHFKQIELVAVTEDEDVKPKQNGCQDPSSLTADNLKKDGNYYLGIVNQEEQHLQVRVKQMQDLLESDPHIPEEASGLIRAAVGKGNLLIRKKFTHYRDCCMKNLHPDPAETRHTTDADLAGLWDIVCIQISDISAMFEQIETLRKNGWKQTEKVETVTTQSTKTHSVKTTRRAKTATNKDIIKDGKTSKARDEARAKAREEAKRRLLAAKKAGRQRKASQGDDVEIYVPG